MEKWDVLDENGNKTGEIVDRKSDFYIIGNNKFHLVSVVWIYNNGKFLCQKRSEKKEIDPLFWSVPGGSISTGESSVLGALREVKEEVGIDLFESDLKFIKRMKRENDFCDVWLSKRKIDNDEISFNDSEVAEVKWFSFKEIIEMMDKSKFSYHPEIYDIMKLL